MQKITILFVVTFLYLGVFGQEKKEQPNNNPYKFNIGASFGYCNYNVKYNDPFYSRKTTLIEEQGSVFKYHIDYSFVKRFAMGLTFAGNGGSSDASKRRQFGISAKYKFISKYKNHLILEIIPIYSFFTYYNHTKETTDDLISKGYGFQTTLGWDHFFDKHFGFCLRSGYMMSNYRSNSIYVFPNQQTIQNINLKYNEFFVCMGFLVRF